MKTRQHVDRWIATLPRGRGLASAASCVALAITSVGGDSAAGIQEAPNATPICGTATTVDEPQTMSAGNLVAGRRAPRFVANHGQWDTADDFVALIGTVVVRAGRGGLWLDLSSPPDEKGEARRALVRLEFEGASAVEPQGERALPGTQNYFLGSDPNRWRSNVPAFGELRWEDAWPGIDIRLRAAEGQAFAAYDIECAPGADVSRVRIQFDGCESLEIGPGGSMLVRTAAGDLVQEAPVSWEIAPDGTRRALDSRFTLTPEGRVGFDIEGRDPSRPLVVDPGLVWATYLGGNKDDLPFGIVLGAAGDPLVVGQTWSVNFPITPGALQPVKNASSDAFVTRIDDLGSFPVFSTYLGGSGHDWALDAVEAPSGNIVLVGYTESTDMPSTPGAFDQTANGAKDGFLIELGLDGASLHLATYIGGRGDERLYEVQVGAGITIAGETASDGLPGTSGSWQPAIGGYNDLFVARLDGAGTTLDWLTYLGGTREEDFAGMAVLPSGEIVVAGSTASEDYVTTAGTWDETHVTTAVLAPDAGIITKLTADGTAAIYSTYLESTLNPSETGTMVGAMSAHPDGRVAVCGLAGGSGFPITPNAFDSSPVSLISGVGCFVTVIAAAGDALDYSTFFDGGGGDSFAYGIEFAENGVLTVFGQNTFSTIPTTPGAFDSIQAVSSQDLFVTRFKPDGSGLLYSSLLGDNSFSSAYSWGGTVGPDGDAWLIGNSTSEVFPVTPGAMDTTWGGDGPNSWGDGVVARMELQPLGVTSYGTSTPSCKGAIRLTALGEPKAGNASFAIACTGAPPSSPGAIVIGAADALGAPLIGVTVYLDLLQPVVVLPITSNGLGYAETPLGLPAGSAGLVGAIQDVWLDSGSCGAPLTFSASDALLVTIGA